MKAALGIALVFTGLTVGYLVLVGKLPMSASSPTSANPPPIPSVSSQCKGQTGTALKLCLKNAGSGGGPMQASIPDKAINGHYMASGGY